MIRLSNWGLSKKTILIVFLCLAAGLVSQAVIYLFTTEKLQQRQLFQAVHMIEQEEEFEQKMISGGQEEKLQVLTTLITLIAPESIMSYDFTTLDQYATALSNDPDIVYAVFLDTNDQFLAGAKELPEASKTLTYDLILDEEKIGTLKIGRKR